MPPKPAREGRPPLPAADVAQRVPGSPRWSQEAPEAMLRRIDAEAKRHDRSRNAEVRVLLAEALDARRARKVEAERKDAAGA